MRNPAIVLIGAWMAGCAVVPPERMTMRDACVSYGAAIRDVNSASEEALLENLKARGYVPAAADRHRIVRSQVAIGMSACAMYAAWGLPTSENRTTTKSGVSIQHVFRPSIYSKGNYVYTENGVVTAIQN